MSLLDKYYNAKIRFFEWLMELYRIDESAYDNAEFEKQHLSIWDYLGQPLPDINPWPAKKIEDLTEEYLYEYEDILIRYPYGIKDPLIEIRKLSYEEIPLVYPDAHIPKKILPGLCMAAIPRTTSFDMKMELLISLNAALVDMENPVEPIINEKLYWDEVVKQSWRLEVAPF